MRRIIMAAILSAAVSVTGATTASKAAPINPGPIEAVSVPVVFVGSGRQRESLSDHNRKFGQHYRHGHYPGIHFGISFRSGHVYFRGYRGYKHPRHGYVFYHGYYFPRFVVYPGVVHKPRVIYRTPEIRLSAAHVRWCYARYKTYRHHDNTYAYKVGKRTYCRSPYSH